MCIWFLTADLMFASRVEHAAEQAGKNLLVESSPATLQDRLSNSNERPTMVLIDLGIWSAEVVELIAAMKTLPTPPRIIAYGPHVHEARLAAAQVAGCDLVLTRGQFDKQLSAMIRA